VGDITGRACGQREGCRERGIDLTVKMREVRRGQYKKRSEDEIKRERHPQDASLLHPAIHPINNLLIQQPLLLIPSHPNSTIFQRQHESRAFHIWHQGIVDRCGVPKPRDSR
jgi:hypothetical protein